MIKTEAPSEGLLFGSFLFREDLFQLDDLSTFWNRHFEESFSFLPNHNPLAEYYSKEMGNSLSRVFFLTTKSFPREFLLSAKLMAIHWEKKWSDSSRRTVNIDIGFLSLENFILATTKNYSHRTYIGQNIFADLTYYFHGGELQTLPWTYPDYLDEQKKQFFLWGRSFLLKTRTNSVFRPSVDS